MNKKSNIYLLIAIFVVGIFTFITGLSLDNKQKDIATNAMKITVLNKDEKTMTVLADDYGIYKLSLPSDSIKSGDMLVIEYTGILDKTKSNQIIEIINYEDIGLETDSNGIPITWKDSSMFNNYHNMAFNTLKNMTLDEKIGQLLLVRYPDNPTSAINDYKVSGFVFFEKDFRGKTKQEVKNMINSLQNASKIKLLTAVDEEGGSVVRVSSNSNLAPQRFKSPQELYDLGGFDAIKNDTIEKSKVLKDLGLNLNLAPVVDVSTNPSDYMYSRTLGKNSSLTSTYAKTVIEASKNTGVSYTLKHFPGYGNNANTHTGSVVDQREYDDIMNNDIPPFEAGINSGAEAVLVSHNIVNSLDGTSPASLSAPVHNLLRNDLGFKGIVITDDIAMGALDGVGDTTLKAVLAGNDLIITTDYETSFNELKNAVENGIIDESVIDRSAFRILEWKYSKGLFNEK